MKTKIVKKRTKHPPRNKSEEKSLNSPERLTEKHVPLVKSDELLHTAPPKSVPAAVLNETQISTKKYRRKQIVRFIQKPESPEKCEIKPKKVKQIEPEKESGKFAKAKWKPPRFGNGKSARIPLERENPDVPSRMGFGLTRQTNSPQIVKFKKKDALSSEEV